MLSGCLESCAEEDCEAGPGTAMKSEHWLSLVSKGASDWSQDGGVGGRRVRVSSQLGHLPGAGGGCQTPKGTGGIPALSGQRSGLISCGGSAKSKPLDYERISDPREY